MHGDYTAILDFNVNISAEHANAAAWTAPLAWSQFSNRLVMLRGRTCSARRIFVRGSLVGGNSAWGTLPETPSPSSASDPMPAGDQAAPAPSPASIIRRSCASYRTSGATQRTCAYASAQGKCTAAPTNTQWPRHPGGTFRATYTAQLALARSLHQRRDEGHCSLPRECVALRRVRFRLQRLRRKPFEGAKQIGGPEHFQGGYEPVNSSLHGRSLRRRHPFDPGTRDKLCSALSL